MKNNLREIRMSEYLMEPSEFAKKLKVNVKSYYHWEAGISKPTLENALRISNILNKNVNDIWYLD